MNTYSHIYLSPHPDDVVLSCGGLVRQQTHAGKRVLVVTIFAAAPAPGAALSPFAQELHARWGHPTSADARRRAEDRAALALLGADVIYWPYADCIYRQTPSGRFPYASEESLWAAPHPAEDALIAELAARIAALSPKIEGEQNGPPRQVIYAPLGVGRHVDHQITRRAAADAQAGVCVYYEDYPYARDPQAVQAALEPERMQWRAELTPLDEQSLEAKITAIAQYRSQLSTFWTSQEEMAAAIRAFAGQVGGGSPAERYWMPGSPSR